jgi:hypothetical protein
VSDCCLINFSSISWREQHKDYIIGICCFSAKHAALRRKSKDWLARNQDNVSGWGDMSIRGLLFQLASTIKIQLRVLVFTRLWYWIKKTLKDHQSLLPNSTLSINTFMFINRMKMWSWRSTFFNMSEWGDMSIRGLLFQLASTIKIQLRVLV